MPTDRSSRTWVMRGAVVVSILAHASFLGAAGLHRVQKPAEPLAPPVDTWAGSTAAPVGGELSEVDVAGSEVGGAPGPVAPPSEPQPPPAAAPEPPPVKEKETPVKVEKPAAKVEEPPAKVEEPPAKVEEPPANEEEVPASEEKIAAKVEKTGTNDGKVPAKVEKTGANDGKVSSSAPTKKPGEAGGAVGATAGSFGAEGPAAVRDLGRAFTRALPPACDSDATWAKLGVGSAGAIEVAVNINEEGKVTGFEPLAPNAPQHLVNAIKRTLSLLRAGTFALQGNAVTAGRQILKLSVELSDTPAPAEEASGAGAFGLASRWEGRRGVASFTQTSGRHVEITVEFLRVELPKG